jgi:hypothetical protein
MVWVGVLGVGSPRVSWSSAWHGARSSGAAQVAGASDPSTSDASLGVPWLAHPRSSGERECRRHVEPSPRRGHAPDCQWMTRPRLAVQRTSENS